MSDYKKFSICKNLKHSLDGLWDIYNHEKPFRIEIFCFILACMVIVFLPQLTLVDQLILFTALFIPLFSEVINSAIERCVDLNTLEYHEMAKKAKDAGSAIVLIGLIITVLIWIIVLTKVYL